MLSGCLAGYYRADELIGLDDQIIITDRLEGDVRMTIGSVGNLRSLQLRCSLIQGFQETVRCPPSPSSISTSLSVKAMAVFRASVCLFSSSFCLSKTFSRITSMSSISCSFCCSLARIVLTARSAAARTSPRREFLCSFGQLNGHVVHVGYGRLCTKQSDRFQAMAFRLDFGMELGVNILH